MLTYGITPPKAKNTEERVREIADKQIHRLKDLDLDALVIYDIQDESDRIPDSRPYPFLPTVDPKNYSENFLQELKVPRILFRSVGNYTLDKLKTELSSARNDHQYVFVGASSSQQKVEMSLHDAYQLCESLGHPVSLGGIMIPERHQKKNDEHIRVKEKIDKGCRFFISQAVYHAEASKDFLSDYYYLCENTDLQMKPIIFTLTLCGSPKTLDFLKWLGVSIPKWVENDLINAKDILSKSFDISYQIFQELNAFAKERNIPVGFNIESVSIKKDEIEASIELLKKISPVYRSVNKSNYLNQVIG